MIHRRSPISHGEPAKADRPIAHRGIRPRQNATVADLNVTSSDAPMKSPTNNTLERYLKDLEKKKLGIKKAWDNNAYPTNHSIDTLPKLTSSVVDTNFSFPSTSRYRPKQAPASPPHYDYLKVNESEKLSKRFSTPLLDMPTPTSNELAELETDISASPFQRIYEWRSETAKIDKEEPIQWELKQWHLLEYWYGICDNNVLAAAQAFYEHESLIDQPVQGSNHSSARHRWPLEDIRRRCQCLDTNIRYNDGVSPRKRRRRDSASSIESRSSTASSWVSIAGQAINKVASKLLPKRQRISRHPSNVSIDDKSSTASVNIRLNRLWTDDRAKLNSRRPSKEGLVQNNSDMKNKYSMTKFDESLIDPIGDRTLEPEPYTKRPPYKTITPERELTPPNGLREPDGIIKAHLSTHLKWQPSKSPVVDVNHRWPLPTTGTSTPSWRRDSYKRGEGMDRLLDRASKEEEDTTSDLKTDQTARVKVNWRENPSATPRRGRVRQLLNQLENGLPLEEAEFEKEIPVYSNIDSSFSL